MSNLTHAFNHGKAFIPFITCGDPSLETTEQLVVGMAQAGADLIILGIPFSDPTAEGPVIQAANIRALANKTTTDNVFDLVSHIRQHTDIPLVFMTYANVVHSYGAEKFAQRCAEEEVDGLIVPDVPFEEKEEFDTPCRACGIDLISIITSTSQKRGTSIAKNAHGFAYVMTSPRAAEDCHTTAAAFSTVVGLAKQAQAIPCAVEFDPSTPEEAHAMAPISDGIIVRNALAELIAQHGEACLEPVTAYVRKMKQAIQG